MFILFHIQVNVGQIDYHTISYNLSFIIYATYPLYLQAPTSSKWPRTNSVTPWASPTRKSTPLLWLPSTPVTNPTSNCTQMTSPVSNHSMEPQIPVWVAEMATVWEGLIRRPGSLIPHRPVCLISAEGPSWMP